jgi:hypothetical protein
MVDGFVGAFTAAAVLLCYLMLVEAMTAAVVLLAECIVLRIRALRRLFIAVEGAPEPETPPQVQEPAYRIGGGLMRW